MVCVRVIEQSPGVDLLLPGQDLWFNGLFKVTCRQGHDQQDRKQKEVRVLRLHDNLVLGVNGFEFHNAVVRIYLLNYTRVIISLFSKLRHLKEGHNHPFGIYSAHFYIKKRATLLGSAALHIGV